VAHYCFGQRFVTATLPTRRFIRCSQSADVEYYLPKGHGVWSSGVGRTIYLSSGSMQIETEHGLPLGRKVELAITWPARLDNHVPLKLQILGRTVEVEGGCTIINIAGYEFAPVLARPARI
jgi:hypothetical protein